MSLYESGNLVTNEDNVRLNHTRTYNYPQETTIILPKKRRNIYPIVKRALDIALSSLALIVCAIFLPIIAILIKIDSKGPVFYSQKRVGKNGKPFMMYKLRSMYVDADSKKAALIEANEREGPVFKLKNDPRVTRFGAILRKTCLDELPQLINILRGDMSIVGPRPALPDEVASYTSYQLKRLEAKPGLTCYWQVADNRDMSFDEWVDLDIRYIHNKKFSLDAKLVLKTFSVIFKRKGDS